MAFTLFISFIILLRIGEMIISAYNERWLIGKGAVEYGKSHYPFIVALHVCFLVSLMAEYYLRSDGTYSFLLMVFYFLLLGLKFWVILTLGRFWNTKIYRIPQEPAIKKGLYRYIKHPNYMIVVAEIAIIPLIFHLYFTAIVFSILNAVMLNVRIKEENKVLNNG